MIVLSVELSKNASGGGISNVLRRKMPPRGKSIILVLTGSQPFSALSRRPANVMSNCPSGLLTHAAERYPH
jgi:hypothetical protein